MNFLFIFLFLSFLPSIAWLIFFLHEDRKPEPGKMILKVFFWGMLISIPVILVSIPINLLLVQTNLSDFAVSLIMVVAVAAVIEETAKYLVVKQTVLKSPECDEPMDLMIYAITAALGFAALENLFFLFPAEFPFSQKMMMVESYLRFISGTFLHALVSGIMGYFIALSIRYSQKRFQLVFTGVSVAILLHAAYNFSIMYSEVQTYVALIAPILLITLFIIVFFCFNKLKKMKSVCKINNTNAKQR